MFDWGAVAIMNGEIVPIHKYGEAGRAATWVPESVTSIGTPGFKGTYARVTDVHTTGFVANDWICGAREGWVSFHRWTQIHTNLFGWGHYQPPAYDSILGMFDTEDQATQHYNDSGIGTTGAVIADTLRKLTAYTAATDALYRWGHADAEALGMFECPIDPPGGALFATDIPLPSANGRSYIFDLRVTGDESLGFTIPLNRVAFDGVVEVSSAELAAASVTSDGAARVTDTGATRNYMTIQAGKSKAVYLGRTDEHVVIGSSGLGGAPTLFAR